MNWLRNLLGGTAAIQAASSEAQVEAIGSTPAQPPASNPLQAQVAKARSAEEDPGRYRPGGYHPVEVGDVYNDRYKVKRKLGYGLYSTVWLVWDSVAGRHAAIKVLTANCYGTDKKPVFELEILRHIRDVDPKHPGYQYIAHLLDDFQITGPNGDHVCLVFPVLGEDINALRRRLPRRKIPADMMRQVARQTLLALDYLHRSCGVIHTDLKQQNMLINLDDAESRLSLSDDGERCGEMSAASQPLRADISSGSISIRIVDFGVASWVDDHLTEWIQPIGLRAPEVFLGAPWDASVDIWCLGCVIFELLQGHSMFTGRANKAGGWDENEDSLSQMIDLFGPIPQDLLDKGSRTPKYYDDKGNMLHAPNFATFSLREKIDVSRNPELDEEATDKFEAFLRSMLQYRPEDRKSAGELATDPWLVIERRQAQDRGS